MYVNMDDPAFAEADYKIFDKIMDYIPQMSKEEEKISELKNLEAELKKLRAVHLEKKDISFLKNSK